jgi:hypothetical protein
MLMPRPFTVAEANTLVPLLQASVDRVRQALMGVQAIRENVSPDSASDTGEAITAVLAQGPELDGLMEHAEAVMREEMEDLSRLGVFMVGVQPTRLGVFARVGRRWVVLSWQEGEAAFDRWHPAGQPFSESSPIDDPLLFGAGPEPS